MPSKGDLVLNKYVFKLVNLYFTSNFGKLNLIFSFKFKASLCRGSSGKKLRILDTARCET